MVNKSVLKLFLHGTILQGILLLLSVGSAQAFPNNGLSLDLSSSPDLNISGITVDYDATGALTATGFATNLMYEGNTHAVDGGQGAFSLAASIDPLTGQAVSGSLSINGTISSLGYQSGTLLNGTLSGFHSGAAGTDTLEFLFADLSGDAASLFGLEAGIILSQTGFAGGVPALAFQTAFSSNGAFGLANVSTQIAEPSTLLMLVLGGLFLWRRSKQYETRDALIA